MNYKELVRSYKDFPKKGVVFWDFTYLLRDIEARREAIFEMLEFLKNKGIEKIAAVEAKGFTLGSILAYEMNLPLILIRKPNLIPDDIYSETFIKEYGVGEYQIKRDAIEKDEKVAVVYDIMAGSSASLAAINLIERCGGKVGGLIYVTELEYLQGRKDLRDYDVFSLVKVAEK